MATPTYARSLCLLLAMTAWAAPQSQASREAWQMRDRMDIIVHRAQDAGTENARQEAISQLEQILAGYVDDPVVPIGLIGIARLCGVAEPERAEELLKKAATYPVPTDPWSFGQREAKRRLADLYERQARYREAVEAFSDWEPGEDCTGGGHAMKVLSILRLRLHFDPADEVLADLWRTIEKGMIVTFSADELAPLIREMYGKERYPMLRAHLEELRARRHLDPPFDTDRDFSHVMLGRLVLEIEAELRLEEIGDAPPDDVLDTLAKEADKEPLGLHGTPWVLFNDDPTWVRYFWKEKLLLRTLRSHGQEAIPGLLAINDRRYRGTDEISMLRRQQTPLPIVAVVALGAIGGKQAIDYLRLMASREEGIYWLPNYYYALLLTRDAGARSYVEAASTDLRHPSRVQAASKALQVFDGKPALDTQWPKHDPLEVW